MSKTKIEKQLQERREQLETLEVEKSDLTGKISQLKLKRDDLLYAVQIEGKQDGELVSVKKELARKSGRLEEIEAIVPKLTGKIESLASELEGARQKEASEKAKRLHEKGLGVSERYHRALLELESTRQELEGIQRELTALNGQSGDCRKYSILPQAFRKPFPRGAFMDSFREAMEYRRGFAFDLDLVKTLQKSN